MAATHLQMHNADAACTNHANVEHTIGESHADRPPLGGGGAGTAHPGLQRMSHGYRHRHAHNLTASRH